MKLKKLIKNIPIREIKGLKDVEITGISANSKLVCPGHLFIAKQGYLEDGAKYIPEAIESGALAILTDMYDPSFKDVTQLIHKDVAAIEALLAAEFYGNPSENLFLTGITGTNGKTTTSYLIKFLLDALKEKCGLIGTIEYIIGDSRYPATRTTPDVVSNHKMLRDMVLHQCQSAVMEVTSHALVQNRVEKIDFDAAVFTNLSLDHLDYHGNLEDYAAAKRKLFQSLDIKNSPKRKKFPKTACLNADSPWTNFMREGCKAHILTYSCDSPSDFKAENLKMTAKGTTFDLLHAGQVHTAFTPMVGRFNIYNSLAAISVLFAHGFLIPAILEKLAHFPQVPGRLEVVNNPLNLKIFVDFAHSDDALKNVLESLQEFKTGKILTIFGCGGDRDRSKRPKMAFEAEKYSDYVFVTTDNPRSEDPAYIAAEVVKGFTSACYEVELDRRTAIEKAIKKATADDIILIAGKGHESYQIFAHKTIEFDDRKAAFEVASKLALEGVLT